MATRRVRFEFDCQLALEKLKYVHNIPATLIRTDAQTQQHAPGYVNQFGRS